MLHAECAVQLRMTAFLSVSKSGVQDTNVKINRPLAKVCCASFTKYLISNMLINDVTGQPVTEEG